MKKLFIILVLAAFSNSSIAADETKNSGMKKYRNYTPQQVKDMPAEERRNVMPMIYIDAAGRGVLAESEFFFGSELNQLMYSGTHDYKAAVLAFQKDLGEKSTGVLTVWQISQLIRRVRAQKYVRIHFPNIYWSHMGHKIASVQGTVKLLDENIYWPVNHHKVRCYKDENYCEVRQIMLDLPRAKSNSTTIYQVLEEDPARYEVMHWSDNVIEAQFAKSPIDGTNCRTTNLSLNFKTKEFYFITKNAGGKCEFLGTKVDKLPKPRISQIVDGEQIINKEFRKIAKAAYEVLSSDFREKTEKIVKKYADEAAEEEKKKSNK